MVGRRNPLSHPRGLEDTGFQSCSHQFWVCCSLCLVSFLPWGPPPPKAALQCCQQKGLPGALQQDGGGAMMPRPHFSALGAFPEPCLAPSPGTSRTQAKGLPARSLLLPTPSTWITGPSRAGQPGSSWKPVPGLRGLGRAKRPPPTLLSFANGNARWRHGVPILPCSGGRGRTLWEL